MYSFIHRVNDIASRKLRHYTSSQIDDAKDSLEIWKNNPNKHEVNDFYKNPVFGIIYTQQLYKCRVLSFLEVLKRVSTNSKIKYWMENTSDIVSIGCGPGPEIAAYVDFMRNICLNNMQLNIRAFDVVDHWKDFVLGSENCDENISITFKNIYVNSTFLATKNLYGICLMSYPEAINFNRDFWDILKTKFDLVLIIDQSKPLLHKNLSSCGYIIEHMEYKGSKKYAYYVKSSRGRSPSYITEKYDPVVVSKNSTSINPRLINPTVALSDRRDLVVISKATIPTVPMNSTIKPYYIFNPFTNSNSPSTRNSQTSTIKPCDRFNPFTNSNAPSTRNSQTWKQIDASNYKCNQKVIRNALKNNSRDEHKKSRKPVSDFTCCTIL